MVPNELKASAFHQTAINGTKFAKEGKRNQHAQRTTVSYG